MNNILTGSELGKIFSYLASSLFPILHAMSCSLQDPEIFYNLLVIRSLVYSTLGPDDPILVSRHPRVSTALVPGVIITNVHPSLSNILWQTHSKPDGI